MGQVTCIQHLLQHCNSVVCEYRVDFKLHGHVFRLLGSDVENFFVCAIGEGIVKEIYSKNGKQNLLQLPFYLFKLFRHLMLYSMNFLKLNFFQKCHFSHKQIQSLMSFLNSPIPFHIQVVGYAQKTMEASEVHKDSNIYYLLFRHQSGIGRLTPPPIYFHIYMWIRGTPDSWCQSHFPDEEN